VLALRQEHGDPPAVVRLTACYHNLLRMWAAP
jgi:PKHD-type hydroxylase